MADFFGSIFGVLLMIVVFGLILGVVIYGFRASEKAVNNHDATKRAREKVDEAPKPTTPGPRG
jgi:cbb3-type cytochrome oxidase subunit 3